MSKSRSSNRRYLIVETSVAGGEALLGHRYETTTEAVSVLARQRNETALILDTDDGSVLAWDSEWSGTRTAKPSMSDVQRRLHDRAGQLSPGPTVTLLHALIEEMGRINNRLLERALSR